MEHRHGLLRRYETILLSPAREIRRYSSFTGTDAGFTIQASNPSCSETFYQKHAESPGVVYVSAARPSECENEIEEEQGERKHKNIALSPCRRAIIPILQTTHDPFATRRYFYVYLVLVSRLFMFSSLPLFCGGRILYFRYTQRRAI